MLQLVGIITLMLVSAAALFAWVQTRPTLPPRTTQGNANVLEVPWVVTLARRIRLFILAIVVAALLAWVGSPTIIVPPAKPANPATAYVLVQGYHSSLLLPDRNGGYIQYAYGDWQYFALNQQDWSNAAAALLIPTQGTLGRRQFSNLDNLRQRVDSNRNQTILKIEVAEAQAAQLLNPLNQRFKRNIDTRVENSINRLSFVQDDQDYTLLHNSNHELVVWLQDLDCEVRSFVILPTFKVK